MIEIQSRHIQRRWETCPRDGRVSRWAAPYATINPQGDIVISRWTHDALGSPIAYLLLYDRDRETIGLKPATSSQRCSYPARVRGRHGGRRIRGYRMLREYGIVVDRTVQFHQCVKDKDGVLLLDLRNTRPANRRSHKKRKGKNEPPSSPSYY